MKSQMLTTEEMVALAIPTPGETAVAQLDEESAHLQMADESAAEPEEAIYFRPQRKASFLKESLILLGLTMIFTSAFWLFLCYLRSH